MADRRMKLRMAVLAVSAAGFACALLAWSRLPAPRASDSVAGHAMGCNWSVKFRAFPAHLSRGQLRAEIASLLERLEGQMSHFREGSDVSQFNRSRSTDWIVVGEELADVVGRSLEISEGTDGAFDVTVAPLVELWGFGPRPREAALPPADGEVACARARVGYRRLEARRSPPALRKHDAELRVDLGAIGKGYALDRVAEHLESRGVREYLIALAGELRARGSWRVGIETPTAGSRRVLRALDLADAGLSTSGDDRLFREEGGKRSSHEIDPRTGRPVDHALASVSVVHPSGAKADALATALMVLGPVEGPALAERMGLAAVFVLRRPDRFEVMESRGFRESAYGVKSQGQALMPERESSPR